MAYSSENVNDQIPLENENGQMLLENDHMPLQILAEYSSQIQELEREYQGKLDVADILRDFRLKCLEHKVKAEVQAAKQDHQNKKDMLYYSIHDDIQQQIQELEGKLLQIQVQKGLRKQEEEKKAAMKVEAQKKKGKGKRKRGRPRKNDGEVHTAGASTSGEKIRGVDKGGTTGIAETKKKDNAPVERGYVGDGESHMQYRKPVIVSGPFIVYMLRDEDAFSDWIIIKKALKKMKRAERLAQRSAAGETSPDDDEEDDCPFRAKCEEYRLIYEDIFFAPNDEVVVQDHDVDGGADAKVTVGRIDEIKPEEIWLILGDGNRVKLSLHGLQNGRYSIRHKT